MTLFEKHWCINLKSNNISDKNSQIIFSNNTAKMFTTRLMFQSNHESICDHNKKLASTIKYLCMFCILNCILYQSISKLNDHCKNIIITERIKLSSKILFHRIQHLEMINQFCQLQSNFWWLLLMQQLHQSLSQSILTSDEKSTFIVIKINMNTLLKIDCHHFILLNHIMLWKISILTAKIFIMSIQIRFKIIRISAQIKKNQIYSSLILKIILLIMLIFLSQK